MTSDPLRLIRTRARDDQAEASDHPARWARPDVRTVAVASGKGGVGRSHLAANLAVALAERGARVLLVDADLGGASLDLLLGLHPRHDLQHWLAGEKTLDALVVDGPLGVRLVPGASVPELAELDDYRRECLLRGLGQIEGDFDLILLDTPCGLARPDLALALAADETIVMTTPEMPSFADAYALIKHLAGSPGAPALRLVVSMAMSPEEAEETSHRIRVVARRFLDLDLVVWPTIPLDPAVSRAARLQQPVLLAFPDSPAAAAYRAMASVLWTSGPGGASSTEANPQSIRLEA
jgi:flagellar biosynthesis protein FlhG